MNQVRIHHLHRERCRGDIQRILDFQCGSELPHQMQRQPCASRTQEACEQVRQGKGSKSQQAERSRIDKPELFRYCFFSLNSKTLKVDWGPTAVHAKFLSLQIHSFPLKIIYHCHSETLWQERGSKGSTVQSIWIKRIARITAVNVWKCQSISASGLKIIPNYQLVSQLISQAR